MRRLSCAIVALCLSQSAGCIFGMDETPMTPTQRSDMSSTQDQGSDLKGEADSGEDMSSPGCNAEAPGQACCDGQLVDTTSDAAHCGGCGQRCADGERCQQGACTCTMGAEPIIVAQGVAPSSKVFLLPLLTPERVTKQPTTETTSFSEFLSKDLSLPTYLAAYYTPGTNGVRLLRLDGRGKPVDVEAALLNPQPSSINFNIKTLLFAQSAGKLYAIILFDGPAGATELRAYTILPQGEGFRLEAPRGELLSEMGQRIIAIGVNKAQFQDLVVAYIDVPSLIKAKLGGILLREGRPRLPELELELTQALPSGSELQVQLEKDQLNVTWWSPHQLAPGAQLLDNASGDFIQVNYAQDGDTGFKHKLGPIKYADTLYLGKGLGLPTSEPLTHDGQWSHYHIVQSNGASTVEISNKETSVQIATPPLAFGQGWAGMFAQDQLFLEFGWVESGAGAAQTPLHGGLHHSTWALPIKDGPIGRPRSPAPLSLQKQGYREAKVAFGAPDTMGFLGLYAPSQAAGELHFYMTNLGELVCEPSSWSPAP